MALRAAFYLRHSTDKTKTENQRPDVEQIARARGYEIVATSQSRWTSWSGGLSQRDLGRAGDDRKRMSRRAIGVATMSGEEKKPDLEAYADEKADELLGDVVERATTGGFSLRPFAELAEPPRGVMVALPTSAGLNVTLDLRDLTEEQLRASLKPWLKRALVYLVDHGDTYLGGWYDAEDGKLYFDVSERYDELEHAKKLGAERNQRAVYRIEDAKLYSTGGTGK